MALIDQYARDPANCDFSVEESGKGDSYISNSRSVTLKRKLGFSHGFALMVTLILGSGVFVSPGLIARDTTSTGMALLIWIGAGIISLLGSLCYCELACMFRMAGGNYANMFKIYGEIPAFLCAWLTCFISNPTAMTTVALTIGVYLVKPFYEVEADGEMTAKFIAFGFLILTCIVNSISMDFCKLVQRVLAMIQIAAIAFVTVIGVWQLAKGKTDNFKNTFDGTVIDSNFPMHVGIALFSALWSYDGWASMNNVVEEMENLDRNMLLTVVTGVPFVIVCYILANISFLTLLSHSEMAASNAVGIVFIEEALGMKFGYVMMVIVALSSFATLNGTYFTIPRLTLAAGREGHVPRVFSYLYAKNRLPVPALVLLTVISSLMLIPKSSTLDMLILLFSQAQWILYTASIVGVVILRFTQPHAPRPFKVFIGIPIFMAFIGVYLVIMPFFRNFWLSVILFGYLLLGIPVYLVFVKYLHKLPQCVLNFLDVSAMAVQRHCNMIPCTKEDL